MELEAKGAGNGEIWKQRDRRTRDLEAKEMDSGEAEGLEKLESIEKAERERPGNG